MWFGKSPKETLAVEGMSCSHCEHNVESGLKAIAGVTRVKADHGKSRVEVYYKDQPPDMGAIRRKIVELGYSIKD